MADPPETLTALLAGDRRALARAITLVESTRPDHRREAEALIEALLPATGNAVRLGISGAPGVGKSSFIEAFGLHLVERGHRVAVLAVDPSSKRSGGSILGDKTRMAELSRSPSAFIRPSPSAGTLGGVARRTRDGILVCEAARFDVVIVETVGVGQSETAVADMVDLFCLLLQPGAGDELQGIKKGIVELAELIVVTKSDGELKDAAGRAVAEYRAALRFLRPLSAAWTPEVWPVSSVTGEGLDRIWDAIGRHRAALTESGEVAARRACQAEAALRAELTGVILDALTERPGMAAQIAEVEARVREGATTPAAGARKLLELFLAS
ncbi:MAG TPA: methylmalonyl Co-A mutase-associated GTPase MeaB [Stellaceae bacterium]|nr:methylmalonyl Co-A mutase-associated GTPase MeaB [Stellaceae bacterium]